MKIKFDIIDVIVALIVGVILGFLATFCFLSPSSSSGAGNNAPAPEVIIESISNPADSMFIGAGSPPQPAPTFTENLAQGGWASKPTENGALERAKPPTLIITAYCQNSCCCGEFADGITASGHIIQPGDCFVAAPPEYPFGTRLSIPGYAGGSMVSVEDRGGKIKGNRLDVFIPDHNEALAWGAREFEVER